MSERVHASAGVNCEIRAIRHSTGTNLNAIISGSGPVFGTYVFIVKRDGGEAVRSESGDFRINSASPTEIKKASIDLDRNSGYRASLRIEWPSGSSSCSANVS
jgi:hypothetical protein